MASSWNFIGWGLVAAAGTVVLTMCSGGNALLEGGKAALKAPPEGSTRMEEAKKAAKKGAVFGVIDPAKDTKANAGDLTEKGIDFGFEAADKAAEVAGGVAEKAPGAIERNLKKRGWLPKDFGSVFNGTQPKNPCDQMYKPDECFKQTAPATAPQVSVTPQVRGVPNNAPAQAVPAISQQSAVLRGNFKEGDCDGATQFSKNVGQKMLPEDQQYFCLQP